jgi:hypothetical protein
VIDLLKFLYTQSLCNSDRTCVHFDVQNGLAESILPLQYLSLLVRCRHLCIREMANLLCHWEAVQSSANDADARLAAFRKFFLDSSCPASSSGWLSLALRGVQDVWSVIRKLCVSSLVHQLQAIRASGSSAMPLRYMHLVQLARASKKSWFCSDGFLLLTKEITMPCSGAGGSSSNPLRMCDCILSEDERVQLTVTHVLELVTHEQLQVRKSAIETVALLCKEPLVDRIMISVVPSKLRQGLSKDSSISTLEGLLELVLIFPSLHLSVMNSHVVDGLSLASHEAATVRQRFADFIAKAHGDNIDATIELLSPLLGCDDDEVLENWKRVETLMMALQDQLTSVVRTRPGELSPPQLTKAPAHSPQPQNVFPRLLQASTCSKFEIRRMGEQVIPLYCQYVIHREHPGLLVPLLLSASLKPVHERLCWFLMLRRVVATFVSATSPALVRESKSVVSDIDAALLFHIDVKTPCISPITRIILSCYGPHTFRRLATQADWESVLEDTRATELACRYAPDFALVSPVAIFIVELWVRELCNEQAPPHIQLLLLEAIKNLIASVDSPHSLLMFTSRADLRAPCLLDGGDDVPEGFLWLHSMLPSLPKGKKLFECALISCDHEEGFTDDIAAIGTNDIDVTFDHSINVSDSLSLPTLPLHVRVLHPLFDGLLRSKLVEPCVVTVMVSILTDLYRRGFVGLDSTLAWLVGRLDGCYGRSNWVGDVVSLTSPKSFQVTHASNSFDDSDDDDEMSVAGANSSSEIQHAKEFFRIVAESAFKCISREEWVSAVRKALVDPNGGGVSEEAVNLFSGC